MSHSMAERDAEENCQKGDGAAWIWNMEGDESGSQRQCSVEKKDQRLYSPRGEKGTMMMMIRLTRRLKSTFLQ